ncbi:fimbrial protein [Pseudomonas sp. PDM19]|uniref:fimbrial protein n=1 Tax=Pseudomonas sp. PDM19 TaxID=2769272 RepID=UPI0017804392|nr:fimbrial protein [Pseudomonas sp. PDM19]MBD9631774.1 type 1 fimbrial protein [Pseudomonas sp. PDM19]
MNKLLVAGMLSTLVGTPAFAYDAQVEINGQVLDESCTINGSSVAPATINVSLPSINKNALNKVGDWAMNTPFTLKLTNCPSSVKVVWEKMANVDSATGALVNTVAGTNAQLRVLDDAFAPINLNADTGRTVTGGAADLVYYGQYYAKVAPVTPGELRTFGYITLQY